MKKIYNIVESNTEPNTRDLWLRGKKIFKFTSIGWEPINDFSNFIHEESALVDFTLTSNGNANLEIIKDLSAFEEYICKLEITNKNLIGSYHNGVVTTFSEGKVAQYNVSFDNGEISLISSFDPDLVMLDLERVSPESEDDTDDIIATRALNLEKMQKTLTLPFLATMDYGIGIGRFINGNGGEINVIYVTGGNGHYTIGADGSIIKDDNYVPEITYDYQAYKNAGGIKSQSDFYTKLVTLIDA